MSQQLNLETPYPIISAKVNNVAEGLNFKVYHNKDIEFLNITDPSARRTYIRSLCFVLYKAVKEVLPEATLLVEHPVSNGYYCALRMDRPVTLDDVNAIRAKMQQIIDADIRFSRVECRTDEAIELFKSHGLNDKAKLLQTTGTLYTCYYKLGDTIDYYYGNLLPSTGYIRLFDVVKFYDGLLLRIPDKKNPTRLGEIIKQEKMLEVFKENLTLQHILDTENVGDINEAIQHGHAAQLINVAEALQEKRIARIADEIAQRNREVRPVKLVLISGPSSSGKTTFSKRLSIQLITNGMIPYPISLDNYFVERENTPLDENGQYDYESLYSLDLDLFNQHMATMLQGGEVELPYYNFTTGKREYRGQKLRLKDNMVLIMEGNHGLNPDLTPQIPAESKFKIYVSALTSLSLDDHNWIPTTDNRLIRRIIRDFNYRGYSAQQTISRWPSVRAGEDKWIFPYQENADAMFNSSMQFEFSALRSHVEPVLGMVPANCPEYSEAYRLIRFLRYFTPIRDNEIPPTSLMREFIGGSSFEY